MAFYIIVHHKSDKQSWVNNWKAGSESLLESITTTKEIGRRCSEAMKRGESIFVHRCAYGSMKAEICASIEVERVDAIDNKTDLVRFKNQALISREPPILPMPGQNSYEC